MCGQKIHRLHHGKAAALAAIGFSCLSGSASPAAALTAAEVRKNMNQDQQYMYMSGIADAFAHARWMKDKPDASGMRCIVDRHYKATKRKVNRLEGLMDRFPDKQMTNLMFVLLKKKCGW